MRERGSVESDFGQKRRNTSVWAPARPVTTLESTCETIWLVVGLGALWMLEPISKEYATGAAVAIGGATMYALTKGPAKPPAKAPPKALAKVNKIPSANSVLSISQEELLKFQQMQKQKSQ